MDFSVDPSLPLSLLEILIAVGYNTIYPKVAETGMGKPLFKASEGGRFDILWALEEITQSEPNRGLGCKCLLP